MIIVILISVLIVSVVSILLYSYNKRYLSKSAITSVKRLINESVSRSQDASKLSDPLRALSCILTSMGEIDLIVKIYSKSDLDENLGISIDEILDTMAMQKEQIETYILQQKE